jgi:hypothetical protein
MKKKLSRDERDSSSQDASEAFELPTGLYTFFSEQRVAAFLGACFRLGTLRTAPAVSTVSTVLEDEEMKKKKANADKKTRAAALELLRDPQFLFLVKQQVEAAGLVGEGLNRLICTSLA